MPLPYPIHHQIENQIVQFSQLSLLQINCFPAWIRTMILPAKSQDMLPLQHRKTAEVRTGLEPVKNGFADRSLTTRAPDQKQWK